MQKATPLMVDLILDFSPSGYSGILVPTALFPPSAFLEGPSKGPGPDQRLGLPAGSPSNLETTRTRFVRVIATYTRSLR